VKCRIVAVDGIRYIEKNIAGIYPNKSPVVNRAVGNGFACIKWDFTNATIVVLGVNMG
jgi:hypothetical protein